jgi:hypothetical protein
MRLPDLLIHHLPFFKKKSEAEQAQYLRELCDKLLKNPDFQVFLTVLLEDMYFYRETKNPDAVALRNYATRMLQHYFGLLDSTVTTHFGKSVKATQALISAKEQQS